MNKGEGWSLFTFPFFFDEKRRDARRIWRREEGWTKNASRRSSPTLRSAFPNPYIKALYIYKGDGDGDDI